ncbi:sensor histidine kinase [Pseudomonas hormoni]
MTIAVGLASLMYGLDNQGVEAQIHRARSATTQSCEQLASVLNERLAAISEQQMVDGLSKGGLEALADQTLREFAGVEGGIWRADTGVIAYSFPTYDGTGIKRDAPSAEMERIEMMTKRALQSHKTVTETRPGLREAVIFSACRVSTSRSDLVAWTMTRAPTITGDGLKTLELLVGLLLGFVVLSGAWLGHTLTRWTCGLQQMVKRLQAANGADENGPVLINPLPGLAELDEVAAALNRYAERLNLARDQARGLAADLVKSERMATLGRLLAGLAHEIRNPLGTIRMKVENALAASAQTRQDRTESALLVVLEQSARLETLITSLLALTQPLCLHCVPVSLSTWLNSICHFYDEHAARQGCRIKIAISPALALTDDPVQLDPQVMGRALDNLLLNALAHVGPGATIEVGAAQATNGALLLWVEDDGPGVPGELRSRLFEPFTTGRRGGSGLGLAFVQEAVNAHGGNVVLTPSTRGARFEMELPWQIF